MSPIIASVLLVSFSLALAVLIFFWARSFIGESITKNDRDVSLECDDVIFDAEAFPITDNNNNQRIVLRAVNNGNVPIRAFEIRKKAFIGDVREIATLQNPIGAGETGDVNLPPGISEGNEIIVVPVLLGETETHRKSFVCDDSLGKTFTVSNA